MDTLILASSSPRRKELLETMGIPFKIHPANCDESIPEGTEAEDASKIIAERKVLSLLERLSELEKKQFILGADTTVIFSGKIYGKPKSKEEAKSFLRSFQGKKQKVVTGIALFDPRNGSVESASVSTSVEFKSMSEEDLERCMNAEEWKDAAGGYKIQGFSACFIKKIDGSYNNVVGLPIEVVYDMLVKHRFEF
ncbi:MAG: septum formation protein Maf [Treponema sp.]|nr:septum formation protein Maf [Treponema sp.]